MLLDGPLHKCRISFLQDYAMDWQFVGIVLAVLFVASGIAARSRGLLSDPGELVAGGCAFVLVVTPIFGLATIFLLWITGNNRIVTGIIVGLLGLYSIGKTLRESG